MSPHIFISHSTQDKNVSDAVVATFEQRGIRCWVAPRDIKAGQEWADAIINAIENCAAMVVVFSGSANKSPQVLREIERAVSKGKIVMPFRIEDVTPSGSFEYFLGASHWLDAFTPPVENHINLLADSIENLLDPSSDDTGQPGSTFKSTMRRRQNSGSPALYGLAVLLALLLGGLAFWKVFNESDKPQAQQTVYINPAPQTPAPPAPVAEAPEPEPEPEVPWIAEELANDDIGLFGYSLALPDNVAALEYEKWLEGNDGEDIATNFAQWHERTLPRCIYKESYIIKTENHLIHFSVVRWPGPNLDLMKPPLALEAIKGALRIDHSTVKTSRDERSRLLRRSVLPAKGNNVGVEFVIIGNSNMFYIMRSIAEPANIDLLYSTFSTLTKGFVDDDVPIADAS